MGALNLPQYVTPQPPVRVHRPEIRLVPEPLSPGPVVPEPPPTGFPKFPAANTNSEHFADKLLRAGRVLSKALFYTQFLEFGGDSTPPELRVPIVDKPPQGKILPAWLDEMREMTEIARLIHHKQAELLLYQHNGQGHRRVPDSIRRPMTSGVGCIGCD
jgi:hypothetical protein